MLQRRVGLKPKPEGASKWLIIWRSGIISRSGHSTHCCVRHRGVGNKAKVKVKVGDSEL